MPGLVPSPSGKTLRSEEHVPGADEGLVIVILPVAGSTGCEAEVADEARPDDALPGRDVGRGAIPGAL